jgi:cytochrome c556
MMAGLAAVFLFSVPAESFAQSNDPVKVRRAIMKENSIHLKSVKKFLKGGTTKKAIARAGTAADMELRAMAIGANAGNMVALFTKGTSLKDMPGKTRAKPAIWSDWKGFQAAAANLGVLAVKLQKAAESGDKAAIKTASATLGKMGCGGCHKSFRGPKPKKKKTM